MSPQLIYLALRAHLRLILTVFMLTALTTLAVSLLLPKEYKATAELLLDAQAPDPVTGTIMPMMPTQTQETVATLIDVALSDRVIYRVVKRLGLEKDPEALEDYRKHAASGVGTSEYFAEMVRKYVEVKPSRDSSVVSVIFTARSPVVAARVANEVANDFIQTHVELQTEHARGFATSFDQRTQGLRADLEAAQARLSQYQQAHGIIATEDRLDVEITRMNDLSTQLTTIQALRAESSSRASQARIETANSSDVLQNPAILALRAEVARAEANLQDLSGRLGRNHPQYQSAQADVDALRARLRAEMQQVARSMGSNNSVNLQREGEVAAALDAQKRKVLAMRAQRDEASVLVRDVEGAQRAYDQANQRLSQTRLASQIDQTNVTLLSEAREPSRHVKPRITINTIVGAVLGLLLGCATAILVELRDGRVRTPEDAARVLDLPLLGVVPQ